MPVHALHDVPTGPNPPEVLHTIVEIPRGSRNKYELDKETGLLRFDRLLYSAVYYPSDYGFFPRTLAEDGDPLDVLLMVSEPTFPGCLVVVRPIGIFVMEDEKGLDEKVLTVPVRDPLQSQYGGLDDVAPHFLKEVQHFFSMYKDLEGIRTYVAGWDGRDRAIEVIEACMERYRTRGDASEGAGRSRSEESS